MPASVLTDGVSVKVFENIILITEEPADGAQASKHGLGLSNAGKQEKCCVLSKVLWTNYFQLYEPYPFVWSDNILVTTTAFPN